MKTHSVARWFVALVLSTISVVSGYAQEASSPNIPVVYSASEKRYWKAENGLVISWLPNSTGKTKTQVDVYDHAGRILTRLAILKSIQEATSGAIYDVSVRRDQLIVVAAVFTRQRGERPAAALLLFDFSGRLLSAYALAPSREIFRVELDDRSNLWTIGSGSGDLNPTQVPMIVEYDTKANVVKELLTRSMFPLHAEAMTQNADIGSISSGYSSGVFWIWLPGSNELVSVKTDDATTSIIRTGLPDRLVVPICIVRDASGSLIAQWKEYRSDLSIKNAYDIWSSSAKGWSSITLGTCQSDRLIGIDQNRLIYIHSSDDSICTVAVP